MRRAVLADTALGAGFLTDPGIAFVRTHTDYVRLLDDLIWRRADGALVIVPKGYEYNGANIPRCAWALVDHPLAGWLVRGAGIHDWGCERRVEPHGVVHREFFDCITFDARTWAQRWWKRHACYRAVRLFGPTWDVTPPPDPLDAVLENAA